MFYAIVSPIHETRARQSVLEGYQTLPVVLSEAHLNELVQDKIRPDFNLAIHVVSAKLARRKECQLNSPRPIQSLLDPEVDEFVTKILDEADKWVLWPQLRRRLAEEFGHRYTLLFNVFASDYTVFLSRTDVADGIMGIRREPVAHNSYVAA